MSKTCLGPCALFILRLQGLLCLPKRDDGRRISVSAIAGSTGSNDNDGIGPNVEHDCGGLFVGPNGGGGFLAIVVFDGDFLPIALPFLLISVTMFRPERPRPAAHRVVDASLVSTRKHVLISRLLVGQNCFSCSCHEGLNSSGVHDLDGLRLRLRCGRGSGCTCCCRHRFPAWCKRDTFHYSVNA
jgi:hypothetical protein